MKLDIENLSPVNPNLLAEYEQAMEEGVKEIVNRRRFMPKISEELKPNYGPVYAAALYPEMAKIFQRHGYALAVHGSLARDFDVIAVPWAETVSEPSEVITELLSVFAIRLIGGITPKPHGRICQTISVGHGHCAVDLSFIPKV